MERLQERSSWHVGEYSQCRRLRLRCRSKASALQNVLSLSEAATPMLCNPGVGARAAGVSMRRVLHVCIWSAPALPVPSGSPLDSLSLKEVRAIPRPALRRIPGVGGRVWKPALRV